MPRPTVGTEPTPATTNPCWSGVKALVQSLETQGIRRLGIAYSGGADSTALLLAAVTCWPERVVALHVNHGLQAAAAEFERHCQTFCAARNIPLYIARLQVKPLSGESPEDAARKARYAAVIDLCGQHAIQNVALAQHADDQVETVLLALSRGAGLGGLAAMPAVFARKGVTFYRPLLAVTARALRIWLAESALLFVEDPTNADHTLTRNRIRHQLLPPLAQAFPAFRQTFARSARHAAQANTLLIQLAELDAVVTGLPPHLTALRALAPERQANLLRYWLGSVYQVTPSEAQLNELLKQIAACTTRGHRLHIKVASGSVQREPTALQRLQYSAEPPPV